MTEPGTARRGALVPLLAAFLAAALAGMTACRTTTDSSLEVVPGVAGAGGAAPLSVRATWSYRSGDVDVDADLTTSRAGVDCHTVGHLVIHKALSAAERYTTEPLPCASLELTETGDVVVHGLVTGHDWSTEPLGLDRDRELLSLGPWSAAEAPDVSYRFELSAPACGACACTRLVRRAGGTDTLLELGRDCD